MEVDRIFYSSSDETQIIRVSDVIPVIEKHVGLKVLKANMAHLSNLEHSLFLVKGTIAERWFLVYFESPEGPRQSMVRVALLPDGLQVPSYEPLQLLRFKEDIRKQIKSEAQGLVLEYIETLEEIAVTGWTLYREVRDQEISRKEKHSSSSARMFLDAYLRVGYLAGDKATDKYIQEKIKGPDQQ